MDGKGLLLCMMAVEDKSEAYSFIKPYAVIRNSLIFVLARSNHAGVNH
jgi:hypothetical protein